jgi:iron complex outermembrane receptor protein
MNLPYQSLCGVALLLLFATHTAAQAEPASTRLAGLKQLSLEELLKVEVSTVSRKEERWWSAPSGIDVVTGEEIRRAAAQTLPDALRLATGVHVAQPNARSWAVSIRGMNVLAANKISVSMDGRSLFTPLFSGVQWDAQDTLMEDIDRIEVVRGPVGALWGAFAVNGFIQILTKPAWDTQGWLASAGSGTEDPLSFSFRYGGKVNDDTFYRVYAKYAQTDWTYGEDGRRAAPPSDFFQTGFRVDALRARDTTLTLQGDVYTNQNLPAGEALTAIDGANILARLRRSFSPDASVEVQAYLDHTYRLIPAQFEERRNTASASLKYHNVSGPQDWLVGFDGTISRDQIGNIGFAQLIPAQRTIHTAGVFVQDVVWLVPEHAAFTFGLKGEHNSFSGFEYQPTVRLAWTPSSRTTLWGAVSRAVRTPVRVDEDFTIRFSGVTLFEPNPDFETEDTIAYEVGLRHQVASSVTLALSGFIYRYDNIRSIEPVGSAPVPVTFKNMLNAQSHGVEAAIMYQPRAWLFFKGTYRFLELDFTRDAGSQDTSRGSAEGNDPKHITNLGVHFDFPRNFEFDTYFRYASGLPNPVLPGYRALDFRLGWRPSNQWEFSLSARNLLDRQHAEFVTMNSLNEQVHWSSTFRTTWRY